MNGLALTDERLGQATDLLRVLAHPTRLRLAYRLMAGECSVAAMERELGIRQPSLSQHLGVLRDAALVTTRREHKTIFYKLVDPRAMTLLQDVSCLFNGASRRGAARPGAAAKPARSSGAAMFAWVEGAG